MAGQGQAGEGSEGGGGSWGNPQEPNIRKEQIGQLGQPAQPLHWRPNEVQSRNPPSGSAEEKDLIVEIIQELFSLFVAGVPATGFEELVYK